jgi:glucose dehydrogenase
MKSQNAANILLFLGIGLSTFGIILISILGRPSYIFIVVGVVLMIVGWIVKRRMR